MNLEFANLFGAFSNPIDFVIIGGVALVLLGGKQIPTFFRSLGDGMKEFKKATREMQEEDNKPLETVSSAPRMMESVQPAAAGLPVDGTPHTAEAVEIPAAVTAVGARKE